VLARAHPETKSALIIGDSIDTYLNEQVAFTSDAKGNAGIAERFLAPKGYNTISLSKPSSTALSWATKDLSLGLSWLTDMTFDTLWVGPGRNDYAANSTAVQIKASNEAAIGKFKARFPSISKVIVRTLPPTTSSGWTTVEGQPDRTGQSISQETERQAYNTIVRALGIVGQTHCFEFATSCEATKGNGQVVWVADGTTDGVHPVAAVNAAAVTANAGIL
jgi:hypothetical protein